MKRTILLLIFITINIFANDKVKFYNPSFSCDKVKQGSIEYKICTDKKLSVLDIKLSQIYNDVKKTLPKILHKTYKGGQLSWIKERNQCIEDKCIENSYKSRTVYLTKLLPKNKAFSPHLIFEVIKILDCGDNNCSPMEKDILNALMNKKDIKILEPIAWGNSLNDDVFKKYLDGMSETKKNKISHVGFRNPLYRNVDVFDYSTDGLKESMKKGRALKAMCNFKLYEIDFDYYKGSSPTSPLLERNKALLMFSDATLSAKKILQKEKVTYSGSLLTILNPKTFKQENNMQYRRAATTNCYKANKTIAGILLYKGIYYHFECWYFIDKGKEFYGDLIITFIQKNNEKFHSLIYFEMKKELK